jgi:NAD(P)-dependent dehydrogenase (short-subunit alcohol dehydrogenase family)
MARRFEGQIAWITGAGTGIGRALAQQLADEGAHVVLSGRRPDKLDEACAAIAERGGAASAVVCDVADEAAVEAAVASILEAHGRLDVAVANAGFGVGGRFEKLSADDWRRQLDINVVGAASTIRATLPALKQSRGRAVLIGSVAAFTPYPTGSAYAASKAAVAAMGEVIALEHHGDGVSCTTIHPGFVESEIARVDNRGVHHPERRDRRPQRLMWPADKAAKVMADAIYKRKRSFVFTGHGKVGAFVGRHLPGVLHLAMRKGGQSVPDKG